MRTFIVTCVWFLIFEFGIWEDFNSATVVFLVIGTLWAFCQDIAELARGKK